MPFARAYSGLTDEEIREVDVFVRRNTREKFGPVGAVKQELPADGSMAEGQEGRRRR